MMLKKKLTIGSYLLYIISYLYTIFISILFVYSMIYKKEKILLTIYIVISITYICFLAIYSTFRMFIYGGTIITIEFITIVILIIIFGLVFIITLFITNNPNNTGDIVLNIIIISAHSLNISNNFLNIIYSVIIYMNTQIKNNDNEIVQENPIDIDI